MTSNDKDWEWVIPPERDGATDYQGRDLSRTITSGRRVYDLRIEAGLSAQEVEDFAGVKKTDLLAVEAGLLEIDNAMADKLAMVLNVSAEQILDGS